MKFPCEAIIVSTKNDPGWFRANNLKVGDKVILLAERNTTYDVKIPLGISLYKWRF